MVITVYGINLNKKINFFHASERAFKKGDKHLTRTSNCDVLLLVYDGVLKFNIDGEDVEVHSGEYYIQRKGTFQKGIYPSEKPKYFFVHFNAKWEDTPTSLPYKGTFLYKELEKYLNNVNYYFGLKKSYIEQINTFYMILLNLFNHYQAQANYKKEQLPNMIKEYLEENYLQLVSLDEICNELVFTKNHIINVFKKNYKVTPIKYILELRIKNAMRLLESTNLPLSEIATLSGFNNYSHFYRKFVELNKISPEKWREFVINGTLPEESIALI